MSAAAGGQDPTYGVVLMNMGGPGRLEEIEPYLRCLLRDRRIVRLPGGFLYQRMFARLVARRRAAKVAGRYAAIGGGSPLLDLTNLQAEALAALLGAPVAVAMRYSAPDTRSAMRTLARQGVGRVVGLPMYPQFSTSTTLSSLDEFHRHLPSGVRPEVIDRHYRSPGYVRALADALEAALGRLADRSDCHVLFTAHSIPVKYTRSGDPYVEEIRQTVAAVVEEAGLCLPHSLAFQSAVRFGKWHGPGVDEELVRLFEAGVRRLVVHPLSFACDNLETLYDLDIVCRNRCEEMGFEAFVRAAVPGAALPYIDGLAELVRAAVAGGETANA